MKPDRNHIGGIYSILFETSQDLILKMKLPKTIMGPIQSLPKIKNLISSVVIEILSFRQKNLTTLYNRI